MIYLPDNNAGGLQEIIQVIEIFQPEMEALMPEGHSEFTKLMVDLIFDALYEYMRM